MAFGIGATKMLEDQFHRPNYQAAGTFINKNAEPGDVIIDESANLSPGPVSHVDPILDPGHRVFRSGSPQEADHPFNVFDKVVSPEAAAREAVAAAEGGRIFFVTGICR